MALLDPDLAEVRSAIFAPLKAAMADGLGYGRQGAADAGGGAAEPVREAQRQAGEALTAPQ